jgi:hypothetical protein
VTAKKLSIALVTAIVATISFATLNPASATNNTANSTVAHGHNQPEILLAKRLRNCKVVVIGPRRFCIRK